MSLSDHAIAIRAMAEAFATQQVIGGDAGIIMNATCCALHDAADVLEERIRAEARQTAAMHACSLDHSKYRGKCPACHITLPAPGK